MKVVFCFVLLFSCTYAFGESDPQTWSQGTERGDKYEVCQTEKIQLPEKGAVEERSKAVDFCKYISYVEWKDFEENISSVTVTEGGYEKQSITVKIKGQEFINGQFKICTRTYPNPTAWECLQYGCCDLDN